MGNKLNYSARLSGREEMHLELELDADGSIKDAHLSGVGPLDFLQLLNQWRPQLNGALSEIPLPDGSSVAAIMLRELILKVRGQWEPPYKQEELCHCRAVPTEKVDQAIICGAHTAEAVSRQTSASTACGTCQPDVKAMIEYRLAS